MSDKERNIALLLANEFEKVEHGSYLTDLIFKLMDTDRACNAATPIEKILFCCSELYMAGFAAGALKLSGTLEAGQ